MVTAARGWRVLHVTDRGPGSTLGGGAEVYVERLVAAQRERGHEVHVFTADGIRTAPALDLWNPFAQRSLTRAIASFRPDVVHVHNVMRELSPSVLSALDRGRTVMTMHDLRAYAGGEHATHGLRHTIDRWALRPILRAQVARHVSRVIAVAHPMAADLRAAGVEDVTVIPTPSRPPVVPPEPPSTSCTVLYAGRVDVDKGALVLADAFRQLAADRPDVRLVVLGDGEARGALERLAADLPGRVDVRGRVDPDTVSRELGRARVVVVPSIARLRREGLPLAAVEAVAHGRPLVTSDDPGAAEVAGDVGGAVVPAEDVPALAAAVAAYVDDPARADADGARAATAAARYLPQRVAAAVDDVYASLR